MKFDQRCINIDCDCWGALTYVAFAKRIAIKYYSARDNCSQKSAQGRFHNKQSNRLNNKTDLIQHRNEDILNKAAIKMRDLSVTRTNMV